MYKNELILKSLHPGVTIDEVAENTGFPIRYVEIEETPPPSDEEIKILKQIDPMDTRNLEFV
jgi:glutaconate CoA-transferase subunit B